MKSFTKANRILLALLAAAVLVSLTVIARRWQIESENKTYDVILDYTELELLADQSEEDISWWLEQFRDCLLYTSRRYDGQRRLCRCAGFVSYRQSLDRRAVRYAGRSPRRWDPRPGVCGIWRYARHQRPWFDHALQRHCPLPLYLNFRLHLFLSLIHISTPSTRSKLISLAHTPVGLYV